MYDSVCLVGQVILLSKMRRDPSRNSFKPRLSGWEPRPCWLALWLVHVIMPVASIFQ